MAFIQDNQPVTPQLGNVLGFTTNIEANDTTFRVGFPYSQTPWSGTNARFIPARSYPFGDAPPVAGSAGAGAASAGGACGGDS